MKIALVGNPNCGKTTIFNALTGSNQYIGNWPGVTVEYKEGKLKSNKNIIITDLPGVYSLSPYTNEEIVTRDYLNNNKDTAIINIIDATNLERNLYLTTQLMELGKPIIIALNMMDTVKKSGDKIDIKKLSEKFGCKIIETIALQNKGINEIIYAATASLKNENNFTHTYFSIDVEDAISKIQNLILESVQQNLLRWTAIKILEKDKTVITSLKLPTSVTNICTEITNKLEEKKGDDIESIIANERYHYINKILKDVIIKSEKEITVSDKIDNIVTNRFFGIPSFILIMGFIYWIIISIIGSYVTDWTNEVLIAKIIQQSLFECLNKMQANPLLIDCIVNGIIGGIGAVLSFVPQIFFLFLFISILEDCGYMVRIAFVMDRIFRKFGLSGKSFIPLLVASGCGVPGIMSSRTIENEKDRQLTIFTTTWIPCGAKLPVIVLFSTLLANKMNLTSVAWIAPLMYLIGIFSIVLSTIILKKTKYFHGSTSPFIMELPQYHIPKIKNVFIHTWDRTWSFIKKAGTVLFLACLVLWFLASFGIEDTSITLVKNQNNSFLAIVGNTLRYLFIPLGWGGAKGGWQCVASTISGFAAKEGIVSTLGVLANATEKTLEEPVTMANEISKWFPTSIAAFSFLLFNLLNSPCIAAIFAMANELKNKKWFFFAILFQNIVSYVITMIVYQIGMLLCYRSFNIATLISIFLTALILYMLFRKNPYKNK